MTHWTEAAVLDALETVRRWVERPDPGMYDEVRASLRTIEGYVDLMEGDRGRRRFEDPGER